MDPFSPIEARIKAGLEGVEDRIKRELKLFVLNVALDVAQGEVDRLKAAIDALNLPPPLHD